MASILAEIRSTLTRPGNVIAPLIGLNALVFLLVVIPGVFLSLFRVPDFTETVIRYLSVPSSLSTLLFRPWTVFTYMFTHKGLFHIAYNMLVLYWMGNVLQEFLGPKKTLNTYLMGGLFGALVYVLAFNLFPLFGSSVAVATMHGASASVLAILTAAAVTVPDYEFNLLLIGPVKLKWIALVIIILDLISLAGDNAGGHFAHLGGAIWGMLYVTQLRKGRNLGAAADFAIDLANGDYKRKKLTVTHRRSGVAPQRKGPAPTTDVDTILDKISRTGYDSLSDAEKQTLFKASNQ